MYRSLYLLLSRSYSSFWRIRRAIDAFLRRYRYEIIYLWPAFRKFSTMNVGFYPVDPDIARDFPADQNQIQLYARVLEIGGQQPANLRDRAVLEVAAGRGGGLRYIARSGAPRRLVGIEQSRAAVHFARKSGLDMRRAFSESLPFGGREFDCVLCVDALGTVSNPGKTLSEMKRVLSPEGAVVIGTFTFASIEVARAQLDRWAAAAGLCVQAFRDVTTNVRMSIEADLPRNLSLFERVPLPLRRYAREALKLKESKSYEQWQRGDVQFYLAALKPVEMG